MNEGLFIFEGFKIPLLNPVDRFWVLMYDSIGYEPYLLNSPVFRCGSFGFEDVIFLFASFPLWIFTLPNLACI